MPSGRTALAAFLGADEVDAIASTRAIDRHAYAHDASHFLLVPDAVAVARDAEDVATLLRASRATRTPLTFRSGGTSLSGQAVTGSVLVDVRRHFRAIEVLDDGRRVRVQPGATVAQVNARLARFGTRLGPDPASEAACTVGGVVANNSSGMACGVTDNTYRTIESMILVLPSGTVLDTAADDADDRLRHLEPGLHAGLVRLRDRVRSTPASVATIERLFSRKNTMGYGLNAFLDHHRPIDILMHLVVGSEGTLAFVASAVFRTVDRLAHAATGLLVFDDLRRANEALPALIETGAVALELMDTRSLAVARELPGAPDAVTRIRLDRHAALLVELAAADPEALTERIGQQRHALARIAGRDVELATDAATRNSLWRVRKGLYASVAGARTTGTTALLEDVVVPVEDLAATCGELSNLFDRHAYDDAVIFGHAKDGNIHFMLTDDFSDAAGVSRYAAFTADLVDLVLGTGGSLKAEHGTGRVMAPYVRRQYGDELYDVMCELKALVDPLGMMNPGVILNEDPQVHLHALKAAPTVEPEIDRCVECGYCEPVCPSRDLTLTPRQRIVVRRAARTAELEGNTALREELSRDYDYEGVQTCAVDGMCQTACPVGINTGDLVKRLRAEHTSTHKQRAWAHLARHWKSTTDLASTALDVAAALPPRLVEAPNRALRRRVGHDAVPLWSADLPRGGVRRETTAGREPTERAAGSAATALCLPSCTNRLFGSSGNGVQHSLQSLCAAAGVRLSVPAGIDTLCCATPWASKGLTTGQAVMRAKLLDEIERATGPDTLTVVSDASSCTEGIHAAVASAGLERRVRVVDAVQFVADSVLSRLPDVPKVPKLTLHPTCSSTRLGINDQLRRIADAVAEEVVIPLDWGCCAFAGDRGLLHPELTAAATAAEAHEVAAIGAGTHASCNRTCEIGMTRATGADYAHILEVLAGRLGLALGTPTPH
ncbi:FAD-binding and (Fe-S)-binding domain-containing protein [Streptomyces sp. Li-HN-5-11]|uniref:FAD-binding and (Fe-S)-binding domain-containing protein n=1 Tax=Streptomyces sp. Li-HN-5-11 TaxID=3075432 RepID=UPI0028AD60C2|nr:FAD-binding and (Fe-S)-binding domain-containing protein [Streptomyces sp. Li-HN-5-11]WNM31712.1 FAD-binding and (Fe-S)-binding domain-containing protein [Streptomyces sp. Li-HN-5-11]